MDTLFRRTTILRRLANEAYVMRRCYEQAGRDIRDPQVADVLAETEGYLALVLVEALLSFDVSPSMLTPELAEKWNGRWVPASADQRRQPVKRKYAGQAPQTPEHATTSQCDTPRILTLHASGSWRADADVLELPIRSSSVDQDAQRLHVAFDLDNAYAREALLRTLRDWIARLETQEPEAQREEDRRAREFDQALQMWLAPEAESAE